MTGIAYSQIPPPGDLDFAMLWLAIVKSLLLSYKTWTDLYKDKTLDLHMTLIILATSSFVVIALWNNDIKNFLPQYRLDSNKTPVAIEILYHPKGVSLHLPTTSSAFITSLKW